ncbi:hypothetical protein J2744_000544 [Halorubrum trapanicum]|uniref:DUF8098 domain-containing protein n=1 Tax=Halorubrum trapanicum TaxID=29284 RepID=A0A8J7UMI4_9EURY|nr:hypothetical protein [Halorubrum trapanicum]MBP1900886.1 hypothetical protein [Halorubrum trapanicum]
MVSNFSVDGDSHDVAKGIKAGLEAALYEEGIEEPDPQEGFSDKNIKIQKEVYRVSEDWGLPIIRTWYRYGQFEPYENLRPQYLDISPLEDPERLVHADYTRREIKSYFLTNNIEDDWKMPLFDFLNENYNEWAPARYKQIYQSNLDILDILDSVAVSSNRELRDSVGDAIDDLQSSTLDLRYELEKIDVFDTNIQSHIIGFLETLQDALVSLEASEGEGLSFQTVRRSRNLYHGYIWPWGAMQISLDQAEAPRDEIDQFRMKGRDILSQFRETFPQQRTSWEDEVASVGLSPSLGDYQNARGEVSTQLGELERGLVMSGMND